MNTEAQIPEPFDFEISKNATQYFLGTHDWKGFCSAKTETASTVRTIYKISLKKKMKNHYVLSVTGDGFLYNMVRIIAGTLIEIGQGKINANDLPNIIDSKDRKKAGKTAQAVGLVLKKVKY